MERTDPAVPRTDPRGPRGRRRTALLGAACAAIVLIATTAYLVVFPGSAPAGPCGTGFQETGAKDIPILVNQSANGTEWVLVLVETRVGLTPSNTCLILDSTTGTTVLGATPFALLSGRVANLSGAPGGLRIQYDGVVPGIVSAGDQLQIATLGTMISTQGLRVLIVSASLIIGITVLE